MEDAQDSGTELGEILTLPWDDFCNLLDDIPYISPEKRSTSEAVLSTLFQFREKLSGHGQYFLPPNSPRHACEVFCLKLSLFEALCREISSFHARTQCPMYLLDPQHVHVKVPMDSGQYGPLLWRGMLTLPNSTALPLTEIEGMPAEMKRLICHVPVGDPVYQSPLIREWPNGREVNATVLIESADPIPDEAENAIRVLVRAHFIAESITARDFSSRDVFELTIPLPSALGTIRFWARKVACPERGIVVSGVTDLVTSQLWDALKHERHQVISQAHVRIYRSYSTVCDGYSAGMLLLRAVLGSNSSRWDSFVSTLPSLVNGLPPAVQGIELSDPYTMQIRVKDYLNDKIDLLLNSAIPSDLWWDAILMGLRAVSRIPDFSYECLMPTELCGDGPIDSLRKDATHLAHRAQIELFASEERDQAIADVCNSVLMNVGMA